MKRFGYLAITDLASEGHGILKDYLRELPEPLFSKSVYQMLLDALTVFLPNDPEGNAKLMFSILDCLPKYNKCTLILIMDHFKLVLGEKDQNKLTAQSIASCFGPLLMCKTDEDTPTLDFEQPIQVMEYLLDIWPNKNENSGNGGVDHLTVTTPVTHEPENSDQP
ncbi:Rho GTPase-activating protein 100F [Nymphon striatum]|nr:Rho GTPase-activating protein 100F [Nymphon striatum]